MSDQQFSFKAWVEKAGDANGGKLHVHGEAMVADATLMYELGKKNMQAYFPDELYLEIKPDPTPGGDKVEIKYHEHLEENKTYKKITIYSKNEEVCEITEIGG